MGTLFLFLSLQDIHFFFFYNCVYFDDKLSKERRLEKASIKNSQYLDPHFSPALDLNPNSHFLSGRIDSYSKKWSPETDQKFSIHYFCFEIHLRQVQLTICLHFVFYKAGSTHVSFSNQKDAKITLITLIYSSKRSEISV